MKAERDAGEHLIVAQKFLGQGDYEGSLKENQKVLSLFENTPPGDEALFNMGLIYAHHEYPKRDYKKSLDLFKKLVKVYPQSPLVVQAKIWIGILQENERLNNENERLNNEIERLNNEIEELNKAIKKTKEVDIEIEEKKKELSK